LAARPCLSRKSKQLLRLIPTGALTGDVQWYADEMGSSMALVMTGASTLVHPTVQGGGDWNRLSQAERAAFAHDPSALVALTNAYLTEHGGAGGRVSAHTRRAYAIGIRMLVADWRAVDLLHPSQDAAGDWLRHLERAGAWRQDGTVGPATPSTVRVRLAAGRALYRALRWAGATDADPFQDARAAPEHIPAWEKRQPYSDADIATLLGVATPIDQVIILLGAHAGLRVAEMCGLYGRDVDLAEGVIEIRTDLGRQPRRVAMSSSLIGILEGLGRAADQPLLGLTDSGVRKRLVRLCLQAGAPYRGVHALRHSAGTRVLRDGGSLEDAARHLGHSNLETARVYAKWADTRPREHVSGW